MDLLNRKSAEGVSEDVAGAVRGILANVLDRPVEEITLESKLESQLGMDSLSAIETSILVEERFGVKMPEFASPDELGLDTVQDLVALTASKIGEAGGN